MEIKIIVIQLNFKMLIVFKPKSNKYNIKILNFIYYKWMLKKIYNEMFNIILYYLK